MKPDKPTENWTKFPNNILDNIHLFTAVEFKILALMIRKNFGYEKPNMLFSQRYIMLKTGIGSQHTVKNALDSLLKKGTIDVISKSSNGYKYSVMWGDAVIASMQKLHQGDAENASEVVQKVHQLKENIVKENILKENKADVSIFVSAIEDGKIVQKQFKDTEEYDNWVNEIDEAARE